MAEIDEEVDDGEPLLKYQRVNNDVKDILSATSATCFAVHESFLVMGTASGTVYTLDFQGNIKKRFTHHSAKVNDVSVDYSGCALASCSDDRTVTVQTLDAESTSTTYTYNKPMTAVRLDPQYSTKREKMFAAGGLAGRFIINRKGWFRNQDVILHEGEGPIYAIEWRGSVVAWANEVGVKIHDIQRERRISFIQRPPCSRDDARACRWCLRWADARTLLVGFVDTIRLVRVQESDSGVAYAEIIATFGVDYLVAGLVPFDRRSLAVVAYMMDDDDDDEAGEDPRQDSGSSAGGLPNVDYPHLVLIRWDTGEEISIDAVPIKGYSRLIPAYYNLHTDPFFNHAHTRLRQTEVTAAAAADDGGDGGSVGPSHQLTADAAGAGAGASGDEESPTLPVLFLLSPQEVVAARVRTAEDHIAWALARGEYEKAYDIAASQPSGAISTQQMSSLAEQYLTSLTQNREFARAASLCPQLLGDDEVLWCKWVTIFEDTGALAHLSPYIPTNRPRLPQYLYEMVYILGRMGNTAEALALILGTLGDVQQAIEFASRFGQDKDLWETLIASSMKTPELVSQLLEHAGAHFSDISAIIKRIPGGMAVPGLRAKLQRVIHDYLMQLQLQRGCNAVLVRDVVTLMQRHMAAQTRAVRVTAPEATPCPVCHSPLFHRPSSTAGSPLGVVVFFCGHAMHKTCADDSRATDDGASGGGGGGGITPGSSRWSRAGTNSVAFTDTDSVDVSSLCCLFCSSSHATAPTGSSTRGTTGGGRDTAERQQPPPRPNRTPQSGFVVASAATESKQ